MSRIPPDRAGYTDFTCTGSEGCPIEALPTTCESGTVDNYKNLPAAVVGNVNNVAYNDLTLIEDDARLKAFSTVCNGTYDPFKGLFIDMYKSFTDNGLSPLIDTSCMDEYPIGYLTPLTPLSLLSAGGSGSGGSSPSGPKCTYLVEYNWECLTQTWRLENVDTFGSTLTTGSWIGAGTWNITRLIVMDDDFTGSCATWNDAWAGVKPAPTRTDCMYCEWVFTATFDCDTKEWHIDNPNPSPSCNVSYMPENWTLTDCFKARKVTRRITSPCDDASNSCQTAVPYEDPSEIDSYITKPECNKCFVEIKADWNCDTDEWEVAAQPAHCLSPEEGNEPHDWEQSDPEDDKHATKLVDTGTACTPTNENCGCTEPYEPSPDDKPVWSPQDCNRCMWKFTIHYNCNENEWDAAQGLKFCESTEDEPEHDWEEDPEDHKIGYKTMYVEGDCTTEAGCTAEKPDPGEPGWDPSLLCKKCAIRYEAEYDCDTEEWTVYEAAGGKTCQDADIEGTGWELIDPADDRKMQRTLVLDYNCREDGACNDQSGDPGQPTSTPVCNLCEEGGPGNIWIEVTTSVNLWQTPDVEGGEIAQVRDSFWDHPSGSWCPMKISMQSYIPCNWVPDYIAAYAALNASFTTLSNPYTLSTISPIFETYEAGLTKKLLLTVNYKHFLDDNCKVEGVFPTACSEGWPQQSCWSSLEIADGDRETVVQSTDTYVWRSPIIYTSGCSIGMTSWWQGGCALHEDLLSIVPA